MVICYGHPRKLIQEERKQQELLTKDPLAPMAYQDEQGVCRGDARDFRSLTEFRKLQSAQREQTVCAVAAMRWGGRQSKGGVMRNEAGKVG